MSKDEALDQTMEACRLYLKQARLTRIQKLVFGKELAIKISKLSESHKSNY